VYSADTDFFYIHSIFMLPPRSIKRWCASDVWLSVCLCGCLSLTSGLSREQRGLGIGTEVAHVTRDSDTTLRSKGQRSTCRPGRGHIGGGFPHSLLFSHFTSAAFPRSNCWRTQWR